MSLSVQWMTMAAMLLSGIGMGVVFDGYRVVSDELKISRWWIPVFDLLYWIAATIIVFQVLSASNEGEVRTYVFIGLLLGIGAYYWLFSKIVVRLVHGLIRLVRALIDLAIKLFVIFVVRPLLFLYKLAKVLLAFLLAAAMFLLKIMVQLVRPIGLLLWWMVRPAVRPLIKWIDGWARPLAVRLRLKERTTIAKNWAVSAWRRVFKRKDNG
ncbi:spore cortex biosynthesis protein YabQ [Paenibacillus xanthanilyticus]|uniref:Spore cortex biosynthesis protein YabQ n=1 Tax=Paenibacillus xanthanilyticus TaxID=1783531 RepID=A0ABV8K008_9BACL